MDYANFNLGANNNILDFQEVLMKKIRKTILFIFDFLVENKKENPIKLD